MSNRDLRNLDLNNILPDGTERNTKNPNQIKPSESDQNQDAEQSSLNLKLDQTSVLDQQNVDNYADNTFWTSHNQTTDLEESTANGFENLPPLVHRLIPQNTDILSEEYIKDEVKNSVESEIKAEKSENKSEKKTDLKQNKTLTEAVKNIAKGISETLGITQPSSSKDFKNEKEFSTGSDSDTSPILNNRRLSLENFRNKRQDFTDRTRGLSGPSKFSLSRKNNSIMVYDVNQEVAKYFDGHRFH